MSNGLIWGLLAALQAGCVSPSDACDLTTTSSIVMMSFNIDYNPKTDPDVVRARWSLSSGQTFEGPILSRPPERILIDTRSTPILTATLELFDKQGTLKYRTSATKNLEPGHQWLLEWVVTSDSWEEWASYWSPAPMGYYEGECVSNCNDRSVFISEWYQDPRTAYLCYSPTTISVHCASGTAVSEVRHELEAVCDGQLEWAFTQDTCSVEHAVVTPSNLLGAYVELLELADSNDAIESAEFVYTCFY